MATADDKSDLALIAAEAAVSIATVSRVLNGRTGVSDRTRVRVEAAIRTRGYVRRTRAVESAPLVELVIPFIQNAWTVELVRGVQRAARDNGMSVVLTKTRDYLRPGPEWIDGVIQRDVGAVVLVFADVDDEDKARLRARNVPFAIVNPATPAATDVPTVGSTALAGGFDATRHLIELGHRRIGMITGPDNLITARARAAGYRQALESADIPFDDELVRPGRFFRIDGENQGRHLLTMSDRPTAIFAGSDPQAFGVYRAARALGLRIPDDLSVVGFDDLEPAEVVGPSLTTVRQPLGEMAETAARIALQQRSERSTPLAQPHLELPTTLIVRGSTAAVPSEFRPVR